VISFPNSITIAIIDSLLEDLGNIFTGSAKKTFGTFNCKNIDSKINKTNIHFDEIIKVKRGSNSLTNSYKTAVTICKS
jgi:hypothetical protein